MADLSSLILLRNDPEAAAELLVQAELGDMNAQYGMGLIYAEGRGVQQDDALAFLWLTLAGDQGDQDAISLRDVIGANMSEADHTRALALYKERRPFSGSPALRRMKRKPNAPSTH